MAALGNGVSASSDCLSRPWWICCAVIFKEIECCLSDVSRQTSLENKDSNQARSFTTISVHGTMRLLEKYVNRQMHSHIFTCARLGCCGVQVSGHARRWLWLAAASERIWFPFNSLVCFLHVVFAVREEQTSDINDKSPSTCWQVTDSNVQRFSAQPVFLCF